MDKYTLGEVHNGLIKYKVGDQWTDKVTDGYKTMFAYYYNFENPQPGKDNITDETLLSKKGILINCSTFSYAECPLSFHYILGVTGTLDTLSPEQHKIMRNKYNIHSLTFAPSAYDIPPHLKKEEDKIEGLKEEILIINKD
jgi:hypothetical protein